jgi:hypothetical protein
MRCWFATGGLFVALSIAGCTTDGRPTVSADAAQPATVAFESIDGAPVAVFQELVAVLNEEAAARRLPVVSRQGAAGYRVRAYMAARTAKRRTYIGWVWDVYDSDRRRAFRIAGDEAVTRATGDGWSGADGEVLRRIARRGFDRLAVFLAASGSPPGTDTPEPRQRRDGTVVAATGPASPTPAPHVPMPPRRPQNAVSVPGTTPEMMALAVPGHRSRNGI